MRSSANPGDGTLVEVFRSRSARACHDRALVLTSQSIPFLQLEEESGGWRLLVEDHWAETALEQLVRYEEENRGFRLTRVLPPPAPFARAATVVVGLVLVLFALAQWDQAFGRDWLSAGAASAVDIRGGALELAVTALTLHADVPHLLSNLVFGALFAYLLFHSCGGGIGALAVVLAGALGNVINAFVHAGAHDSIGASTAVFGAVGLLGGSEARTRHLLREQRSRRFAPVFAALLLLLYLGVGQVQSIGERQLRAQQVDVLAHVFGLAAGLVLGLVVGSLPRAAVERKGLQAAAALAAAVLVALAWRIALSPR